MKYRNYMEPYMGQRIDLLLGRTGWKYPVLELAKRTGYSREELNTYIYDCKIPNVLVLMSICRALNVSADYILFGSDKK